MKRQFAQFLIRWGVNVVGIFFAAQLLSSISYQGRLTTLLVAGCLLAIINALIKPMVTILALPALVLTLGVFSVVINGAMVFLAHIIYKPFEVTSFSSAILAGLVIGLVNYIMTRLFDLLTSEG